MGPAVDPRRYTRVSLGGLALRGLPRGTPTEHCFCEVRLLGSKIPVHLVPLEVLPLSAEDPDCLATSATFYLSPVDLGLIPSGERNSPKKRQLEITVVVPRQSWWGRRAQGKAVGSLRIPVTQQWSQSSPYFQPVRGWKAIGNRPSSGPGPGPQLHLCVTVEADPRQLFEFEGQALLNPQVVHVEGPFRQPVFSCKFRSEAGNHRRSYSGSNNLWSSPVPSPSPEKERKGWMVTVHDLSGFPVAAASMVTPFISSRATGKVTQDNPGAWLIMRPEGPDNMMQPWARLEAWREQSGSGVACNFELLGDEAVAADGTMGSVVCREKLSVRHGGEFSLHAIVPRTSSRPKTGQEVGDKTMECSSRSEQRRSKRRWLGLGNAGPFSSAPLSHGVYHGTQRVQPVGTNRSIDFRELEGLRNDEGFVMKTVVRKGSHTGTTLLEIGRCHVLSLNDAAVFVALAAAVELSVEACKSPSKVLRRVLKEGDAGP